MTLIGCAHDARDLHAARVDPATAPARLRVRSWPLCGLVGAANPRPGIYGTDLGYTVRDPSRPGQLAMLFGDTWAQADATCRYPVLHSDDLQALLPLQRPAALRAGAPTGSEAAACRSLEIPRTDARDATSFQRIRLFASPGAKVDDTPLDTGALRTPVAAFSDGEKLFSIYYRGETVPCRRSSDCPESFVCSADAAFTGRRLGVCAHAKGASFGDSAYCRDVTDCASGLECRTSDHGLCVAAAPFEVRTAHGSVSPAWYRNDPRLGAARVMDVAVRISPERPADYAVVHRFVTNRFVDVAARTVAYFDAEHPEKNDYRPGTHTLLLWGRASWFALEGAQELPFLLYQSLDALRGPARAVRWAPRFFAGYDERGLPRWSEREGDAQPVYGTELRGVRADGAIDWAEPEFDYVNQMTVSYVEPLGRFVMLYGGDVPAFMVRDPRTLGVPSPYHLQRSPGAIHLRTAPHPWGRIANDPLKHEGWSSPVPVLTRAEAAPYLACGDGGPEALPGCVEKPDPGGLFAALGHLATAPGRFPSCLGGELAHRVQDEMSGNPIGRLYGANLIDEWSEDVTASASGIAPGERAVDLYWNASTWSPYQVVLVKTELRGPSPAGAR